MPCCSAMRARSQIARRSCTRAIAHSLRIDRAARWRMKAWKRPILRLNYFAKIELKTKGPQLSEQRRLPRAERRRIEKDHGALVGKPLALPPSAPALEANTRHLAALLRGRGIDRASRAAGFAAQLL